MLERAAANYTFCALVAASLLLAAAPPQPGRGPYLGVLTEEIPEAERFANGLEAGVRVLSTIEGSPAHGRLLEGDVILALDEEPVSDPRGFLERSAALPWGSTARLLVERAGSGVAIDVATSDVAYLAALNETDALAVVGGTYVHINLPRPAARSVRSLPPPAPRGEQGFLGVSIQDNPDGDRLEEEGLPRGALVRSVLPGSAAQTTGIRAGDVITWVAGRPVATAGELMAEVASRSPGSTIELVLQRQDQQLNVTAMLKPRQ